MKAKINFDGNVLSSVDLIHCRYTMNERIMRSLKMFLILFSSSLFCILIPVLHIVLFPLLFILSFVLPFKKFKELISIDLKNINCPGCRTNLNAGVVSLRLEDSNVRIDCNSCRKSLTIMLEDKIDENS